MRAGSSRAKQMSKGACSKMLIQQHCPRLLDELRGPLNRLNAIPSLLHPLDSYRTPSAIARAIGRPYLSLSRILAQVEVLNSLILNRLGGSTARL